MLLKSLTIKWEACLFVMIRSYAKNSQPRKGRHKMSARQNGTIKKRERGEEGLDVRANSSTATCDNRVGGRRDTKGYLVGDQKKKKVYV